MVFLGRDVHGSRGRLDAVHGQLHRLWTRSRQPADHARQKTLAHVLDHQHRHVEVRPERLQHGLDRLGTARRSGHGQDDWPAFFSGFMRRKQDQVSAPPDRRSAHDLDLGH